MSSPVSRLVIVGRASAWWPGCARLTIGGDGRLLPLVTNGCSKTPAEWFAAALRLLSTRSASASSLGVVQCGSVWSCLLFCLRSLRRPTSVRPVAIFLPAGPFSPQTIGPFSARPLARLTAAPRARHRSRRPHFRLVPPASQRFARRPLVRPPAAAHWAGCRVLAQSPAAGTSDARITPAPAASPRQLPRARPSRPASQPTSRRPNQLAHTNYACTRTRPPSHRAPPPAEATNTDQIVVADIAPMSFNLRTA
jgi:hypothetical protein